MELKTQLFLTYLVFDYFMSAWHTEALEEKRGKYQVCCVSCGTMSIHPMDSKRVGGLTAKILMKRMKLNWNFRRGWRGFKLKKKTFVMGYEYFVGPHTLSPSVFLRHFCIVTLVIKVSGGGLRRKENVCCSVNSISSCLQADGKCALITIFENNG